MRKPRTKTSTTDMLFLVAALMGLVLGECVHASAAETVVAIEVERSEIVLTGRRATWQILVDGRLADDSMVDITAKCQFMSEDTDVVTVTEAGIVTAVGDGEGRVHVTYGQFRDSLSVTIQHASDWPSLTFETDVIPILNRYGCNGSGCHGKAEGQNGFKLSVFGFDPAADYDAIAVEGRGRRVFPAAPRRSLLLEKMSGIVPHGGGVRIPPDERAFEIVQAWIELGMPKIQTTTATVKQVALVPSARVMSAQSQQRLRVEATYSDGRVVDVTPLAQFQSNNEALATVDASGLVATGSVPGSVAIMTSFMGHVDVFSVTLPRASAESLPPTTDRNYIDQLVHEKLRNLNIPTSPPADDATFLRRVYLDLIGRLPTVAETRQFLSDARLEKRRRLVDQLLERSEFADFWALKWSDLLRVNRQALGHKQAYAYYRWIHRCFAENVPLDDLAYQLVTAEGPLQESPAGNFYKVVNKPNEMASTLSQVFLGLRIDCAQCHHHPFDRWSQTDYYGMQAFFTQVGFKKAFHGEAVHSRGNGQTAHPRTKEPVYAHVLGTTPPATQPAGNRRQLLAEWMTSESNPWFARNMANRIWADLMGRGLVEPVDDFRLTNPPTDPALLDALAQQLVRHDFDMKALIREITLSHTYQRSSRTLPGNAQDQQHYSRYPFKSLPAEVLFDAVCDVTGTAEKFAGVPAGVRAIQLWDSEVRHGFLKLFGRPTRISACECERVSEPSVAQVLHGFNSGELQNRLARADGRIARMVSDIDDNDQLAARLYLTFLSRPPAATEREAVVTYLVNAKNRQQAAEDVSWSLMNSLEFLFNH